MNINMLERNLELLRNIGYNEDIIDNTEIIVEKNKEGLNTFKYKMQDGRSIYAHSKYNILNEINGLFKNIDFNKDGLYIVYGLGMAHHIKELKKRASNKSFIFVIEKNMDIVSTYLKNEDFSDICFGNIVFFFGSEQDIIANISTKIFAFNTLPLSINIENIIIPFYSKLYGKWIEDMNKRILDLFRHSFFYLGNDIEDTIIGIENNFKNIKELIKSSSIQCVKDKYNNVPVIIVGAGPSLDKNIEELKKAKGKALIFATDAVISTLKKHDIIPDIIVSIERILLTYEKFYKDNYIDDKIVFVGPPVVRKEIFEKLKNNKKLICLKKGEKINEWIGKDILKEDRFIEMGTSCSHIAFSFAKYVGANPIVLIGQDLAFTKEGVTHSSDVEVKEKVETNEEDLIFVRGIDGSMLPTNEAYKNFLTWFEIQIAKDKTAREYIDATEGGAYKDGTILMTLKDVIEKYCKKDIRPLYDVIPNENFDIKKYELAIESLEKLFHDLDELRIEAQKQILRLDKLQNKVIRDKENLKDKDLIKIYEIVNKAVKTETLILKNDLLRTLFQAPLMLAVTNVKALGNEIDTENAKKNVKIQKKMTAAVILGCYAAQKAIGNLIEDLQKDK